MALAITDTEEDSSESHPERGNIVGKPPQILSLLTNQSNSFQCLRVRGH